MFDIDEHGVATVVKDGLDWYEWAPIEYSTEPLFDEEEPLAWLWPGRVPLGLVTVIEGAVSVGKSPLVADLIARATRGSPWPGAVEGPQPAGDVLLVCGELGGWTRVVLPRLKRAGADLTRVARLEEIISREPLVEERGTGRTSRPLRFPDDLPHVEYHIRARPETRLVVIDPLAMYCPDARAWRETLRKLHEIAARRNVAIVVVTGRGSRASVRSRFQAGADPRSDEVRALFNVLEDAEDAGLRYFAPARMSFGAMPDWLAFRIVDGRVLWEAPVAAPPEEALCPRPGSGRGAVSCEVTEWMRGVLQTGAVLVEVAKADARARGYSAMTVRRVREQLKVRTVRRQGRWWWTLAAEAQGSEESKGSKRSKNNGAHDSPGRAPDVSPGITPRDESALARLLEPYRIGVGGNVPRKRSSRTSPGDWRHFREALLEELQRAEELRDADLFGPPPSNGNGRAGNGRPGNGQQSSNGKHSSNSHDDSNGEDPGTSNGKRRKPR